MFQKVLIAEDFDSINIALVEVIKGLGAAEIQHTKYCDDALLKLKKAVQDHQPFDLVISDLSFTPDARKQKIINGEFLVKEIRKLQPTLALIVYSVEDKPFRIKTLFNEFKINAYILKGRRSIEELKTAIQTIFNSETRYVSKEIEHFLHAPITIEIKEYDIHLLRQLSYGVPQEKMDSKFKELNIEPNSKSTIEKRIGKLKDYFKASNAVQLVAIAKDMGVI